MNKLIVRPPQEKRKFYVSGMAAELENHIISTRNGDPIGDESKGRAKRILANGEERSPLSEPDSKERAIRTLIIKSGITEDDIKKWHEYENKHCDYLLCSSRELWKIFHKNITFPKIQLTPQCFKYLDDYARSHQPPYKEFEGFKIPPYFVYDLEFDGMEFEHETDWRIYYGEPFVFSQFLNTGSKNEGFKN